MANEKLLHYAPEQKSTPSLKAHFIDFEFDPDTASEGNRATDRQAPHRWLHTH